MGFSHPQSIDSKHIFSLSLFFLFGFLYSAYIGVLPLSLSLSLSLSLFLFLFLYLSAFFSASLHFRYITARKDDQLMPLWARIFCRKSYLRMITRRAIHLFHDILRLLHLAITLLLSGHHQMSAHYIQQHIWKIAITRLGTGCLT
jgi:hypothetical protein